MSALDSVKIILYTKNKKQFKKFLQILHTYFDAIVYCPEPWLTVIAYKTCVIISLGYERVGFGLAAKERAVNEYKELIQTKLIKDFPSFYVEFFMYRAHFNGFKKQHIEIGPDCFLANESLGETTFFKELGAQVDITNYYLAQNRELKYKVKNGDWTPVIDIETYIDMFGEEKEFPCVYFTPNKKEEVFWSECQIMD